MYETLSSLFDNSYSPYSGFSVAAVCVMKDGRRFTGVNVENVSFGATICAERTAIVKAISEGYGKGDFGSLHIACRSGEIITPCFMCRQVISEFFDTDCEIVCYGKNGESETFRAQELCPYPFSTDLPGL